MNADVDCNLGHVKIVVLLLCLERDQVVMIQVVVFKWVVYLRIFTTVSAFILKSTE